MKTFEEFLNESKKRLRTTKELEQAALALGIKLPKKKDKWYDTKLEQLIHDAETKQALDDEEWALNNYEPPGGW